MDTIMGTGYEAVMVIWGVVFIVGAVAFIYFMNLVFQTEQKHQDAELGLTENSHRDDHSMRPTS